MAAGCSAVDMISLKPSIRDAHPQVMAPTLGNSGEHREPHFSLGRLLPGDRLLLRPGHLLLLLELFPAVGGGRLLLLLLLRAAGGLFPLDGAVAELGLLGAVGRRLGRRLLVGRLGFGRRAVVQLPLGRRCLLLGWLLLLRLWRCRCMARTGRTSDFSQLSNSCWSVVRHGQTCVSAAYQ